MKLEALIQKIEEVESQIDRHGKLSEEILKKVQYKFRLDWNYHSNRMEGGTLTRDETRSVMVGNVSIEGKPLKDVLEMNGHDQVVQEILKVGTGEKRLSEKRIKEVHRAIIDERDDPNRKKQIGEWKSIPNEIINYQGEKIAFAPPGEVAEKMHRLLDRTNAELDAFHAGKKNAKHPLFIASDFHLEYVTIHPFFDGNGRSARIFSNLILISCGYPPTIIKDDEKEGYYKILADIQAYGGNAELFYQLMGKILLRSLEMLLDAIEGREIQESDDITKEIHLLNQRIKAIGEKENVVKKTPEGVSKVIENIFEPMLFEAEKYFVLLEDNFVETKATLHYDSHNRDFRGAFSDEQAFLNNMPRSKVQRLGLSLVMQKLKIALPVDQSKTFSFLLKFEDYKGQISFSNQKGVTTFYYGDQHQKQDYTELFKKKMSAFIGELSVLISSLENKK